MLDRGQTETLGFVLVFAIITASIGLVYASGFTGLNDVREFEQVNNAERAFEVFADNIEDITHRNAPSRSTEIKLADAELRIAEAIQVEVNDPDSTFNVTYDVRPVIYDPGTGTELVYAQGAVIRDQRHGGVVVKEGTLLLDANRSSIPVVQTRHVSGQGAVSGSTTVLVRARQSQTQLVYVNTTTNNKIWFNVTSPRAEIWHDHLTSTYPDVTCNPVAGSAVNCSVSTDRVYVTVVKIDLSIE
ncbi:MAG: hypothetical protein ABEJ92_06230 [Halobacteriales archaeon]